MASSRATSTAQPVRVVWASSTLGSPGSPRTEETGRRRKSTMASLTPRAMASWTAGSRSISDSRSAPSASMVSNTRSTVSSVTMRRATTRW